MYMIHMGIDLPSSSQHSLPMPRGAPTLNHIGAQQLSLWNWVLMALVVVRITMHGDNDDDDGKDKVNIRSAHHSYDGGDNDLPSGQVALTSLHWGSVRSSKAEEKLLSLCNIQCIVRNVQSAI